MARTAKKPADTVVNTAPTVVNQSPDQSNDNGGQLAPVVNDQSLVKASEQQPEAGAQQADADKAKVDDQDLTKNDQSLVKASEQQPEAGAQQADADKAKVEGLNAEEQKQIKPGLTIVNNSPSLLPLPMIYQVIEPYGSLVVDDELFNNTDLMKRLQTEANALNELRGYELIELKFSASKAD